MTFSCVILRCGCSSRWQSIISIYTGDWVQAGTAHNSSESPCLVGHLVIRSLTSASSYQEKKAKKIYLPYPNTKADNCSKEQRNNCSCPSFLQGGHCTHSRSSSPLPESQQTLIHRSSCTFQALLWASDTSSFKTHNHLKVGNWGTDKLRNFQAPKAVSGSWAPVPHLSPGLLLLPFPCLPSLLFDPPHCSCIFHILIPLLKCSSQHSQLVAPFLYSFSVPYSFSSEEDDFTLTTI